MRGGLSHQMSCVVNSAACPATLSTAFGRRTSASRMTRADFNRRGRDVVETQERGHGALGAAVVQRLLIVDA